MSQRTHFLSCDRVPHQHCLFQLQCVEHRKQVDPKMLSSRLPRSKTRFSEPASRDPVHMKAGCEVGREIIEYVRSVSSSRQ